MAESYTCCTANKFDQERGDPTMTATRNHHLKFRQLPGTYAIVRFAPDTPVPAWASSSKSTTGGFTSITRTADELSVVCPTESLPSDVQSPHRWICLKLEGPFPFSVTGVLLSF